MKISIVNFYKKNLEKLKEIAGTICPDCIQNNVAECRHYDYLRAYIKELEALPPFDSEKFELFWKAYPRKTAKPVAMKKWQRMGVDDELFNTIMTALEKHKQTKQWAKDNIIPHPSTWLNQERWNDEVEVPAESALTEKYKGI